MNEPMGIARRHFLGSLGGVGLGSIALAWLESASMPRATAADAAAAGGASSGVPSPIGLPGLPHFAPKAKRVIFLTQSGGPSQIELFDHKPGLVKLAGQELPESVRQGQRLTTMTSSQKQLIMPSRTSFGTMAKAARRSANGCRIMPVLLMTFVS